MSQLAQRLAPRVYFALRERGRVFRGRQHRQGPHHEMKAAYLDTLVRLARGRVAVDVGANKGWYCLELAKVASRVIAFEPNAELGERLAALLACSPYNASVQCVALSDHDGTAELRVPVNRSGSATLESSNLHVNALAQNEAVRSVSVALRRLDGLDLGRIDVIKIDVEGHQLPLIAGARQTLERDRPDILIEVDERHRPGSIAEVDASLRALGYHGYFLLGRALLPMARFRLDVFHAADNSQRGQIRINDFFYFHESKLGLVRERLADLIFYPES